MMKSSLVKSILIFSAALLISACTKLTKVNYDKLEMGMNLQEVESVLGSHDNCSSALGTQSCLWGDENGKYVKVSFVAGAAVTFSSDGL